LRDLYAFVGRDLIGVFHEASDGAVFEYADSSLRTPLSLSIPRGQPSSAAAGINYLDNLLPDRTEVRQRWARERDLPSADVFSLATAYGEDVAGVVSLSADPERGRREETPLIEATDDDIAARIATLRQDDTSWIDPRVRPRMSLAGAQGKFSLVRIGDRWFWPTYDHPSTHILKPPSPKHDLLEKLEALALDLARAVGIEAAIARTDSWLDQPCFVIERFDRNPAGQRIPAEDVNQALGSPVDAKYSVTAPQVARLMALYGNERRFVRQLAFNVALGNSDAHAKNYSLLLAGERAVLAPLYDAVPTILYPQYSSRYAMTVGRARYPGELSESAWRAFAARSGLDGDVVWDDALRITTAVADRLVDHFAAADLDEHRQRILAKHARILRRGLA